MIINGDFPGENAAAAASRAKRWSLALCFFAISPALAQTTDPVQEAEERYRRIVLEDQVRQVDELQTVAWPMFVLARPLCGAVRLLNVC